MSVIADLHIHSKYSMATSRDLDPQHLELWARYKGIHLLGTGDFTHPAWREALSEALEPAEEGLYRLKSQGLEGPVAGEPLSPRFVISGEISCIYKQDGKTRKVHNLILLPSLEAAEELSKRLEAIGNIRSDGRPILGLSSRDLLEITLESCPDSIFIPAHIWTPHFSMLGAFSDFSSVKDCYQDLSPHIHALETGLSSDPAMNHRVSALDGYTLVSHSDAHSPSKLGREANLLDIPLSYPSLKASLETGAGFLGTLEFFPEEGKYHLDGHRACKVCLEPAETLRLGGICPVCGRKLTVGVQHRVEQLADREAGYAPSGAKPFESIAPLPEILAACMELSASSKAVSRAYFSLLEKLGPEFFILRKAALPDVEALAGPAVAEGLSRLRAGKVLRKPGFDGEFGVVSLFAPGELAALRGQLSFGLSLPRAVPADAAKDALPSAPPAADESPAAASLNEEQQHAVDFDGQALAVIAGPGTGKTGTLVARIERLLREGVKPAQITAVTFTNQAAKELQARLEKSFSSKRAVKGLNLGTFHSLCLRLLPKKALLGQSQARRILAELFPASRETPAQLQEKISRVKNGQSLAEADLDEAIFLAYQDRLRSTNVRDLDDLLLEALQTELDTDARFTHLLVDEFQDINPLQRRLVLHFAKNARSLFVIGDADQSIYGFRGASANCFDELEQALPALQRISLKKNYRSSPEVLGAALHLISHNPGGERALAPMVPSGPSVRLIQTDSDAEQALFLSREVAAMTGGIDMLQAHRSGAREQARSFLDMAILCRTNRQLLMIEEYLKRGGIPCVVTGRESYLDDEAVQGALGFFRFLLDPANEAALTDALLLAYGCGRETIAELSACTSAMASLNLDALDARFGPLGETGAFLAEARSFLPKLQKEKPSKLLERWMKAHGATPALEKLLAASLFHKDLPSFLDSLLLGLDADVSRAGGKGRISSGAVRLMTLHASKGLEFPVVFLAGLTKGLLPLERKGEAIDLEEERRLLFVGMTRAKEELVLCTCGEPSPFVAELPPSIQMERPKRQPPKARQLSLF